MFQIFCGADVPGIRQRETSALMKFSKLFPSLVDGRHTSNQAFNRSGFDKIGDCSSSAGILPVLRRAVILAHYYKAAEDCPS
jgi:hypothetical protein